MSKNDYASTIASGQKISAMMSSEGWKAVLIIFDIRRDHFMDLLLNEKELNKIYYYQASIHAIDDLLLELKEIVNSGMDAQKELLNK